MLNARQVHAEHVGRVRAANAVLFHNGGYAYSECVLLTSVLCTLRRRTCYIPVAAATIACCCTSRGWYARRAHIYAQVDDSWIMGRRHGRSCTRVECIDGTSTVHDSWGVCTGWLVGWG